jgi:flagellar protein FliO/FliZ
MSRLAVAALTLAVGALTPAALLAQAPPPPPEAPAQTPLSVRPARPIELAPEPHSSRFGVGLAALAAGVGAAFWLYRRRGGGRSAGPRRTITISARQAIGVRSELIVVEIDGQGMLLGVTPGAIQRLALLPAAEEEEAVTERDVEPAFRLDLLAPAVTMPSQPPESLPETKPEPRRVITLGGERRTPITRRDLPVEEQVRGLVRGRRSS